MESLQELLESGQTQKAREEAERLLAEDPENLPALVALAKAHLVKGDLDDAEPLIRKVEQFGASTDSLVLRANLAGQRNQRDVALGLYQQAAEREPPQPEAFFGLGIFLADKDDYPGALKAFERAVELAPRAGVYHYHLARTLLELEQPERALEHLEKSLTYNPLYPPAYLVFSKILSVLGKLEEARELLHKGLKLMPDDPRLLAELTNVSLIGGDVGGAFQSAAVLADLSPHDPAAQTNLAMMLAAQGRHAEALAICRGMEAKGLATAPLKCVEAMVLRAQQTPDLPGAIKAYEAAMALDPTDWSSANNLGLLLLQKEEDPPDKNVPRAITALEEASRRRPDQLEPQLNLALAYARANQKQKSLELAQRLLQYELPPDNPLRQQAERLVQALAR